MDATGHETFMERVARHPAIAAELIELAGLLQGLEDTPLCLHAAYGAREILTSVGWLTASRRAPFQAGTLSLISRKTELLFVTLDKSAACRWLGTGSTPSNSPPSITTCGVTTAECLLSISLLHHPYDSRFNHRFCL